MTPPSCLSYMTRSTAGTHNITRIYVYRTFRLSWIFPAAWLFPSSIEDPVACKNCHRPARALSPVTAWRQLPLAEKYIDGARVTGDKDLLCVRPFLRYMYPLLFFALFLSLSLPLSFSACDAVSRAAAHREIVNHESRWVRTVGSLLGQRGDDIKRCPVVRSDFFLFFCLR